MSAPDTTASKKPQVNIPETDLCADAVRDILIKARVKLLISQPFFGNEATRLNLVDATNWCPTLATDGKNFYYNRNLVAAFDKREGENEFGFGHEVLHCVLDHFTRKTFDWEAVKDRDAFDNDADYVDYMNNIVRQADIWNIANDQNVNDLLIEAQVGTKITTLPIIHQWEWRGKTSEELYDQLVQEAKDEGRTIEYNPFDMHLPEQEPGEGDDAPGEGNNDGTNGPIKYTKEEREKIKEEVQNSVITNARANAGSLPAGLKRILNDFLNPQLDWRELLPCKIQSTIKNDYTYRKPSRKGLDAGFYLPSMDYDESIDVVLGMDTSGSMSEDMLRDILSEVQGCMEQFTNFKIHIFCYDTEVHNPQTFDENNMDEFMEYEPAGGGGTDFDCCYEYMKEQNINPALFVNFTDGYPWNSWGDETFCETLFIVHGGHRGDHPVAPFGTTVPYTREG
jgi:predicted metal-dependent peptidase